MGQQLALFRDDSKAQTLVRGVSPDDCRISRFNTRKTRDDESVLKLAQRMTANGFELTRALWVYQADDGQYEVFAGGTRLEAARRAGVSVDVVVHEGYSWEDISRLSDQDNENDEYHQPVRPMDTWAEYARLRDEEGWQQKQIAETKNVDPMDVSRRLRYHELPVPIKVQVGAGDRNTILTEGHLMAVLSEIETFLLDWALWNDWRIEALETAIEKKWSSRQLATHWQGRKDAVVRANDLTQSLPDGPRDEYVLTANGFERLDTDWRSVFAEELKTRAARSVADVDLAFSAVRKRQELSDERKRQNDERLDIEQQKQREEERLINTINDRWKCGDSTALVSELEDASVRLVLTDPPYGVDFQSNRRVVSGKADKVQSDATPAAAAAVFTVTLAALAPKLQDDAHLLVFTHWKTEFVFRAVLEQAGYIIRGSLIWVKENHTSGDLDGAFAPRHERIIHATKGHPGISPRMDDVLVFARENATDHPMEKPTALLRALIECTTVQGQLVIDPFAGTASSMVAALETSREWWGCEIDQTHWNDGYGRLNNAIRRNVQEELGLASPMHGRNNARAA